GSAASARAASIWSSSTPSTCSRSAAETGSAKPNRASRSVVVGARSGTVTLSVSLQKGTGRSHTVGDRRLRVLMTLLLLAAGVTGCRTGNQSVGAGRHVSLRPGPSRLAAAAGIRRIKHVVVITQENRSFDSYFGTYPG